jgi:hypothetical protein
MVGIWKISVESEVNMPNLGLFGRGRIALGGLATVSNGANRNARSQSPVR